MAISL